MMLFYSKNKGNKILLDPPPKKNNNKINKGSARDAKGRDMATRTSVCLYQQPMTGIFTRSRLSDSDYKVIPSLKIIIHL